MASFGARLPYFFPIQDEPKGARPIYTGKAVLLGRLVKADLTVNLASGELYADDVLVESASEFVSGSVAMETDDMEDATVSEVYGAEMENGVVHYNSDDEPPKGGLGYLKKLMRNKKVLFKAYFYPLAKAAVGNDTAQTKNNSITFGTSATQFTIYACESGAWRDTFEAATENAALQWLLSQAKASAASGAAGSTDGEPDSGDSENASGAAG